MQPIAVSPPVVAMFCPLRSCGPSAREMKPNESQNGKMFFPSGAIVFFVLLLLLYAVIWFTLYWIMIVRS